MTTRILTAGMLFCALAFLACEAAPPQQQEPPKRRFDPSLSHPRAVALANKVIKTANARRFFDDVRYLGFSLILKSSAGTSIENRHEWNLQEGDYKVSWQEGDSSEFLVYFNFRNKQRRCFRNNRVISDSTTASRVYGRAYATFVRDSWWLLMPFKLKAPGTILHFLDARSIDGQDYDIVRMTFNRVGLTPENIYDLYINRASNRIDRIDYYRDSLTAPVTFYWSDWQEIGGYLFALRRTSADGNSEIIFRDIDVSRNAATGIFSSLPNHP